MKPRWLEFKPPEDPGPPETILPGWYNCTIISVTEKISQQRREPYYSFGFQLDGVHPEFRLWKAFLVNFPMRAAMDDFADFIEAVTGVRPRERMLFHPETYVGKRLRIGVGVGHYQDRIHNTVKSFSQEWGSDHPAYDEMGQ